MIRQRKFWSRILKITVLLAFALYLYYRIDLWEFKGVINETSEYLDKAPFILSVCIVVLLMPVNWILEAMKWRSLLRDRQNVSLLDSIKSILTGLTVGILTPFRLGEYVGRLRGLSQGQRPSGLWSTFISSVSQWSASFIIGVLALIILYDDIDTSAYLLIFMITAAICSTILVYYAEELLRILPFKMLNSLKSSIYNVKDKGVYTKIIIFSTLRFLTFATQYAFIVNALQNLFPNLVELSRSSLMFLLQRFIPLPGFLGIPVRSELSVWIWNNPGINIEFFTISSTILWFINILVPSSIGLIILMKTKIKI